MNVTAINSANLKYNQLLVASLTVPICRVFGKMRDEAIESTQNNPSTMLTKLRSYLREIKSWNQDVINTQCVAAKTYCNARLRGRISLDRLIETSLVSTAKIMGTPRIGKPKGQVEINVPESSEFVKDAFIKCARELHTKENIVLFTNKASKQDQSKNEKSIRKIVRNCVEEFILTSIPLEEILDNASDEADMVEEAKQILEDAKEEVKVSDSDSKKELPPSSLEEEVTGENEEGEKDEEGMPPISDVVPIEDELNETQETKELSLKKHVEEDENENLIKKREKQGYYDENDHGFFSDSDLNSDYDDDGKNEYSDGEEEEFELDE